MLEVLIPAYNEAETISQTVRAVLEVPGVRRVLVVDDGSGDDTARRAAEAGALVVRLEKNQGKGAALNRGAALLEGPFLAFLDADLGESARELEKLARPVLAGEADLAIASFPRLSGAGGFGLVKGLARLGIFLLGGVSLTSPLSGQRVLTRAVLEAVLPFAPGYGVEVAMTVRAARRGFRIVEVPTAMRHRTTGRDLKGFLHRGRQFWHVLRALAGLVLERGEER